MSNRTNFYRNRIGGSVFSENRRIWRHKMTSYPTFFQKIHFRQTDFRKNWHDCSFWRYKVTEKNSERFWHLWRRYDVIKIVGNNVIGENDDAITTSKRSESFWIFFLWTCIIKMNNRAKFYENPFGRSVFSEKCQIWRHTQKRWRHNFVKNVGIDLNFLRWIFTAKMNIWFNF